MRLLNRRIGFAVVALLSTLASSSGDAAGMRCRSDPTVVLARLGGGLAITALDLQAVIDAPLWDVQNISYTIHIPSDMHVIAVVRTPNWPTTTEQFTIVADGERGVYDTTTTVRTAQSTDVTAQLLVNLQLVLTNGRSGQALRARIAQR